METPSNKCTHPLQKPPKPTQNTDTCPSTAKKMSSRLWDKSSYTPEYSDELLSLVADLYKDEIKPVIKDLKLSKMIDLIEVAQYNLEKYKESLMEQRNSKALANFIVGLFYIYYVIPSSIQFQIKNKNHEVFSALKQIYERETNMTNAKLQVIRYIKYIDDKKTTKEALPSIRPKRSQTLPSSAFQQDLSGLLNPPSISITKTSTTSSQSSAASITSVTSSSSSLPDDLYLPPDLQPNDKLELIDDNNSNEILQDLPEEPNAPDYPAPNPPPLHHSRSFPDDFKPFESNAYIDEELFTNDGEDENPDTKLEYFATNASHRKDSYHSVYATEGDDSLLTLKSKQLYEDLTNAELSYLIFDIRPLKRFEINHIPYDNIVNIDPSIVLQSADYQELEDALRTLPKHEFQLLKNMDKFDQVLTYSDNSTFLKIESDYLTKLAIILDNVNIKSKTLSGGFDSWVKFVSKSHISGHALNFKAKLPKLSNPPSFAPPPIPQTQPLNTIPPYDYSKILPQYEPPNEQQTQVRSQSSFGTVRYPPPPPPPHLVPYQRAPIPIPQQHPVYQDQQFTRSDIYPQQYYHSQPQYYPQPQQIPQYNQQFIQRQMNRPPRPRVNSNAIPTIEQSAHPFVRLSITGLRNMKNTCYINSMIQCLFSSTQFRDLFLDNRFEDYLNPKFTKSRLSPSLSTLFKKMYLNGGCSIVPSGFLKACVRLRPDLKIPNEQQDTQEFLMFLLDQLHNELSNSPLVVSDYPELMQHEVFGEDYDKWFEGLIKQGFSPLSKIFQGQLQDSVKCMNCGFKSSNYSSFYMLSLGLPKHSSSGKKLKKVTLEDCIQLFTSEEILTGDNAWDCPKCSSKTSSRTNVSTQNDAGAEKEQRKHRLHFTNGFRLRGRSSSPAPSKSKNAKTSKKLLGGGSGHNNSSIKSLTFVSLPPVLIIHLSRFLFYDTSQKDDAIVQYPLLLDIDFNGAKVRYKLYGIVNHYGTLKSGHYTSITNKNLRHDLNDPNWYYFDDEVVKVTNHGSFNGKDQTHMSSSDVYVLFYERVN